MEEFEISTKETLEDLKELRVEEACAALLLIAGQKRAREVHLAWKCAFLAKKYYINSRFISSKDFAVNRANAIVWYHLAFMADECYKPDDEVIQRAIDVLLPLTGGEGFTMDERNRARELFKIPGKVRTHSRTRHRRDLTIEDFPTSDEGYKPLPWDRDMIRVKAWVRGCKSEAELIGKLEVEGLPLIGALDSDSGARYVIFRANGKEVALKNLELFMTRK